MIEKQHLKKSSLRMKIKIWIYQSETTEYKNREDLKVYWTLWTNYLKRNSN